MRRQTTLSTPQNAPAKNWLVVDATDVSLGRLSVDVATILMGKHRPEYTPHVDCGDFVVVINASKVGLTGRKAQQKTKMTYSRHPGGEKHETYESLLKRKPQQIIEDAVRRMLPKNRLSRHMLTKLKVYPGADHPHGAQAPVATKVG